MLKLELVVLLVAASAADRHSGCGVEDMMHHATSGMPVPGHAVLCISCGLLGQHSTPVNGIVRTEVSVWHRRLRVAQRSRCGTAGLALRPAAWHAPQGGLQVQKVDCSSDWLHRVSEWCRSCCVQQLAPQHAHHHRCHNY